MNEIIEQARMLGTMIAESDEMKRYQLAQAKQNGDPEALALMERYQAARQDITDRMRAEDMTPEKLRGFQAEIRQTVDMLAESDVVTEFLEAKQELNNLVSQVNSVISYCITGEEETGGSCGGNCSGCSGCH